MEIRADFENSLTLDCLLYPIFSIPIFFDVGEEGGGFEAQEFGGPAGSVNFPAGLVQGSFDIAFSRKRMSSSVRTSPG